MKLFHAHFFLRMVHLLDVFELKHITSALPGEGAALPMDEAKKSALDSVLDQLEEGCIELELVASLASARRLRQLVVHHESDPEKDKGIYNCAKELQGRLVDELEGKYFWSLTTMEAAYYTKPLEGWKEIVNRFPTTLTDIEEMSKCFALSRYAGAVFHSVQAVECGLIELGEFLNVNDPKSGWTAVNGKLTTLVTKTKYSDLDPLYQTHFAFLEQVNGTVGALNNAWRNKISHAQGRLVLMTSEFSPDVAEEIMIASRSFMRRLATEMP
jgi:hypothetical protein